MKHVAVVGFAVLFGLSACAQPVESTTGMEKQTETTAVSSTVSVTDLVHEEGTVSNTEGDYSYTYQIPQIEADTPGAKQINEEIRSTYEPLVNQGLEAIQKQTIPDVLSVTYERSTVNQVLSLIVKQFSYVGLTNSYTTYAYDLESGEVLTREDLLTEVQMSEEDYSTSVIRAALHEFDQAYYMDQITDVEYVGDVKEKRSQLLSYRSQTQNFPVAINQGGNLVVAVPFGDTDNRLVEITPDSNSETIHAEYSDYVRAEVTNHQLTITFTNTPAFQEVLQNSGIQTEPVWDTPIPVSGCYSDYGSMIFLDERGRNVPKLYLITDQGLVEYVDLGACIQANQYPIKGPLEGITEVVSLESGIADTGDPAILATRTTGEQVNLWASLVTEDNTMPNRFVGMWSTPVTSTNSTGTSNSPTCLFEIQDYNQFTMMDLSTPENPVQSSGTLQYLGMEEEGLLYTFIQSRNDIETTGVVILGMNITPDSTTTNPQLLVQILQGEFLPNQTESIVSFTKAVG